VTIIIPFVPSTVRPFSFSPTLDGIVCNVIVTWNVSSQRYFINVYDNTGRWVVTTGLVSSPPARTVDSVVYDPNQLGLNVFLVDPPDWPVPLSPGGLATKPGTIMDYTLENFSPSTFNGEFRGMHITETHFIVPMAINPGIPIITGVASRILSMVSGYFNSTLIYRNSSFEVSP